jgi:hypothetical protein
MADLTREFEQLADPDVVAQFAAVGGGFLAADLINGIGSGTVDVLPDEAYGVLTYVALGMFDSSVPYAAEMQMGAGANTVHALAQRFGLVETIRGAAGGAA